MLTFFALLNVNNPKELEMTVSELLNELEGADPDSVVVIGRESLSVMVEATEVYPYGNAVHIVGVE